MTTMGLSLAAAIAALLLETAAQSPVNLGTASNFTLLAGSGITIAASGMSEIVGDIGSTPTATVTGLENLTLIGVNHGGDAVSQQAHLDLASAQTEAAGLTPDIAYADGFNLGGQTLGPGVYNSPATLLLSGTLYLDAGGNPDAVWIIQAGSTLGTSPDSHVSLVNGAQAKNVFWQVGSSATLGTGSSFAGTILAFTSITLTTGASVNGRLLAQNGAVALDFNALSPPPTLVVLYAFSAGVDNGQVVVRWHTASEENTVGFYAERWNGDTWARINISIIPAQGLNGFGAAYSLVDAEASACGTYAYRLVEVVSAGAEQIYGPFERTASALEFQRPLEIAPGGIRLRWLGRADETYRIERSTNLVEGFLPIASGIPADPAGNEFIDAHPHRLALYRILANPN